LVHRAPTLRTIEKTARQGGFFVYRARDYDENTSISRRSFLNVLHLFFTLPETMVSIKKNDIKYIISQKSGDSSFLSANVFYNAPSSGDILWELIVMTKTK
jgi:hypothetical protein